MQNMHEYDDESLTTWLLFDNGFKKVLWCHIDLAIKLNAGELDEASFACRQFNGLFQQIILKMEKKIISGSLLKR